MRRVGDDAGARASARIVPALALVALVAAAFGSITRHSSADGAVARRVYAPCFAGDVRFDQAAIFWFGQITPTSNYADVRVGCNDEELQVHVAVSDRRLWYNPAPGADALTAWDAVTVLISLDGTVGATIDANDYRFTGQLSSWEESRTPWQAAWRGSTEGWSAASLSFSTASGWRGDAPNTDDDDRGWTLTFHIPFQSLGHAGKPAPGAAWGMAVLVHDRDDAQGTPIPDQKWPEQTLPASPTTWAQLVFGLPSYQAMPAIRHGETTIRDGLNGAAVPDAVVGGNTNCGSGMDYWTEWGNKNYAGLPLFNVQNQADISDWPCFSKYYVSFPLDGVPAGKSIISATLQLHQFGNAGAGWDPGPEPSFIQVLTVAEDWSEATLTWNNAPMARENLAGAWVNPIGDPVPPEGARRVWDVSRAVADAHRTARPLRLVVYSADHAYHSGRYFRSSEFGDAPDRPTLIVRWGDPLPQAHRVWTPFIRR